MAKTRSQNKISPEEHIVLQPSSKKVKKICTSNTIIKNIPTNINVIEPNDTNENCSLQSKKINSQESKIDSKQTNSTSSPAFCLRKREEKKDSPARKKTKAVAIRKPILSISSLFNICKQNNSIDLVVGQLVLAKMQTYSPWPAKIMEIKDKKVTVFFFGTNNHGTVKKVDCVPIQFCGPVIMNLLESKQANLRKAVEEMKLMLHLVQSSTDIL